MLLGRVVIGDQVQRLVFGRFTLNLLDEVPDIADGKTTTAIVQVRVNQARFRRAILASYNATCCMSGLRVPKLLVASHIVPWSMDTQNRLTPAKACACRPCTTGPMTKG